MNQKCKCGHFDYMHESTADAIPCIVSTCDCSDYVVGETSS